MNHSWRWKNRNTCHSKWMLSNSITRQLSRFQITFESSSSDEKKNKKFQLTSKFIELWNSFDRVSIFSTPIFFPFFLFKWLNYFEFWRWFYLSRFVRISRGLHFKSMRKYLKASQLTKKPSFSFSQTVNPKANHESVFAWKSSRVSREQTSCRQLWVFKSEEKKRKKHLKATLVIFTVLVFHHSFNAWAFFGTS